MKTMSKWGMAKAYMQEEAETRGGKPEAPWVRSNQLGRLGAVHGGSMGSPTQPYAR
jgi:hypothetical protein